MFNKGSMFKEFKQKIEHAIFSLMPHTMMFRVITTTTVLSWPLALTLALLNICHLVDFKFVIIMVSINLSLSIFKTKILDKKEKKIQIDKFLNQENYSDFVEKFIAIEQVKLEEQEGKYKEDNVNWNMRKKHLLICFKYFIVCSLSDGLGLPIHDEKQKLEQEFKTLLAQMDENSLEKDYQCFKKLDIIDIKDLFSLATLSNNLFLFSLLQKIYPQYLKENFDQNFLEDAITEISQHKNIVIHEKSIIDTLPKSVKEQLKSFIYDGVVPIDITKENCGVLNKNMNISKQTRSEIKPLIQEKSVIITPDLAEFFNDKVNILNRVNKLNEMVKQHANFFTPYEQDLNFVFKELQFFTKTINIDIFHETLFISQEVNNLIKKTLPNLIESFIKIMKIEAQGKHTIDFKNNLILLSRYLTDCHEFLISILQQDFNQNSQILLSKFGEFNMQEMIEKNDKHLKVSNG